MNKVNITTLSKIESKDDLNIILKNEIKSIELSEDDKQYNDWWELFETIHIARKANLNIDETWNVLSSRFEIKKR